MKLRNIRIVAADGPWGEHVVDVDQTTLVGPTCALGGILSEDIGAKTSRAHARGFLEFVDFLRDPSRGISADAAPATIVGATKAYLRSLGLTTKKATAGPWTTVNGPDAVVGRARTIMAGVGRGYDAMSDAGFYDFPSPFVLSEEAMRQMRLRAREGARDGRISRAVMSTATFRFGVVEYKPPRRTQVELVRNVVEVMTARGWPPELRFYLMLLLDSGCRPSDPVRFTMLDWYLGSRLGCGIESTNKGDGDRRVKVARFTDATRDFGLSYVDGARRAATAGALSAAEYLRIGDAGDHSRLEAEPLLVDAAGRTWTYDRIAGRFRRDFADLCIDPVTGKFPLRRPTLHWLRHLFIYDHLMMIEDSGTSAEARLRAKEELVAYIGWRTGLAMLATYGREFLLQRQAAAFSGMSMRRSEIAGAIRNGTHMPAKPAPAAPQGPGRITGMFRDRRLPRPDDVAQPVFAGRTVH